MFMLNDKPLPLDTPFVVGEGDEAIQYPANWLRLSTAEEKAALGITEVADTPVYDDRLYWGVGNPKDIEVLKPQWVSQLKDTANKLLAPTDWMVLRQLSRNVSIPQIYVDYRTAVIDACTTIEAAINACTTVEELAAVQFTWPSLEQ